MSRIGVGNLSYHANLERLGKRRVLRWATYRMIQTLKGWGSVTRWRGQPIIIVQTLKGWGSVTRWRGQPIV